MTNWPKLRVTAVVLRGGSETGERLSDGEVRHLRLAPHSVCPMWYYTLSQRTDWDDE
ncbi:protein of unknown function (plasmid) [Azospirillum baldaniorum]|uniref:Uncharacterized protein n=1 Tax=Azospirillum baldaniorum TaxID=1064539 RepID=A0A9P1K077_9PROT|nr:protein of unknown function [Azospirillum baldaniorum]